MLARLILLPLLLTPLAPALAQEAPAGPETVVLQGFTLPEGTAVLSSANLLRRAEVRYYAAGVDLADDPNAEPVRLLDVYTFRADSVLTTFLEVSDAGPTRIEQFVLVSDILEDVHEGDELLNRGRHPNPLSGTRSIAQRTATGEWERHFLLPAAPTEEQEAALAEPFSYATPQYPQRPVAVGETWHVEREYLELLFGELAPGHEQRMSFRLDSTGTYLGSPAAYLSYGLNVTLDRGPGTTMHRHEAGLVVRLLDHFVDVREQRQGTFRTVRTGSDDNETPYTSVMEGEVRASSEHLLTIPAGGSPSAAPAEALEEARPGGP